MKQKYVPSTPTLIPDVRAHVSNWRQFKKVTNTWPVLSIATFLIRFLIMIAGVIVALWYSEHHDWSRDGTFLICLAVGIPVIFLWFLLERVAWNHDLRQKGIASESDVWGVTQFPSK
jgi:membrane protein YdbS with pleckstrin-like domain